MKKQPKSVPGEIPLRPMSLAISNEEVEMYKRVAAMEHLSVSQWARNILTKVAKESLARENNYKVSEQLQVLNQQVQAQLEMFGQFMQNMNNQSVDMGKILETISEQDEGAPGLAEVKELNKAFGAFTAANAKKPSK